MSIVNNVTVHISTVIYISTCGGSWRGELKMLLYCVVKILDIQPRSSSSSQSCLAAFTITQYKKDPCPKQQPNYKTLLVGVSHSNKRQLVNLVFCTSLIYWSVNLIIFRILACRNLCDSLGLNIAGNNYDNRQVHNSTKYRTQEQRKLALFNPAQVNTHSYS